MEDITDTDDGQPDPPLPQLVPALQIVGLAAVCGVAVADLIVKEAEVPWIVYGLIGSIVIGVAPETLWKFIRGR